MKRLLPWRSVLGLARTIDQYYNQMPRKAVLGTYLTSSL
jgi:hypothetical protein